MLRNVTLQERPIQTMTLVSAADAALRARRRQYEAARYLIEREQAADRLEQLVRERTRQLQEANDQLVAARDSLKMALDAAQMITWDLDLGEYTNGRAPMRDHLPEYNSLLQSWSRAIVKKHILPDDRELFETAFRQALDTGSFRLECRLVWPDDSVHWVVAEGRLYRDDQGDPVRLAGTLRDVTERRQVGESLRQTQKLELIGQLTGGVAHDFNNLLTAVVGNIELAALRTQDEKLLHILRSAGTAAERGAKLTGQLLAFARRQHLAPRVVVLNELVSSMGDLLLQTIGAAVRVETVLDNNLWAVLIDATQLELVLLNLAINSRDAMPHGGRLTIATKNMGASDHGRPTGLPVADYVAISVSDTGTGMTREVAAKAFEPLFGPGHHLTAARDDSAAEPIHPHRGRRANPRAPPRRGARACAGANPLGADRRITGLSKVSGSRRFYVIIRGTAWSGGAVATATADAPQLSFAPSSTEGPS